MGLGPYKTSHRGDRRAIVVVSSRRLRGVVVVILVVVVVVVVAVAVAVAVAAAAAALVVE